MSVILTAYNFGPKEKAFLQDLLIEFRQDQETQQSMEQLLILENVTAIMEGNPPPNAQS